MTKQAVSLARFNDRTIAKRAVQMLEEEGLHPVLSIAAMEQPQRDASSEVGDWLELQAPWAEADSASAILDEFLDAVEEEADEEEELALGQR